MTKMICLIAALIIAPTASFGKERDKSEQVILTHVPGCRAIADALYILRLLEDNDKDAAVVYFKRHTCRGFKASQWIRIATPSVADGLLIGVRLKGDPDIYYIDRRQVSESPN